MKYKSKLYAQALAEILAEKKLVLTDKKLVDNFLNLLAKNGDLKKAKEIIALAETIYLKKSGNKKFILETARELGKNNILKGFAKEGDALVHKISPEMVAGIKITINNEKQLDFSLQKKLNEIFK